MSRNATSFTAFLNIDKRVIVQTFLSFIFYYIFFVFEELLGHDHLLEIRLLEKSARHDFIIARHRLSNNIFSCQLLDSRRKPVKQ